MCQTLPSLKLHSLKEADRQHPARGPLVPGHLQLGTEVKKKVGGLLAIDSQEKPLCQAAGALGKTLGGVGGSNVFTLRRPHP